jgi:hypothetical protein
VKNLDELEKTVKSIKLTSGEELVGFVHEIGESFIEVQSPFQVTKAGLTSFSLLPWMVTAETNQIYAINILNVSSVAESTIDFLNAYLKCIKKTEESSPKEWESEVEEDEWEEEMEEDDFYSFNLPPDESIH